jgi:hypothetical protein
MEKGGELPVNEAQQMFGEQVMRSLWEKYMLEYILNKIQRGYRTYSDHTTLLA